MNRSVQGKENRTLVGKGKLMVKLLVDLESVPPTGGTIETDFILDGTTGPVAIGNTTVNFDALSPLHGVGLTKFDLENPDKGFLSLSIRDQKDNIYQVISSRFPGKVHCTHSVLEGARIGESLRSRDGQPYSFETNAMTWTTPDQETLTSPYLGVMVESCNVACTNLDALIAAKDPSDESTYFELRERGSYADPKTGQVYSKDGEHIGRLIGEFISYEFEFYMIRVRPDRLNIAWTLVSVVLGAFLGASIGASIGESSANVYWPVALGSPIGAVVALALGYGTSWISNMLQIQRKASYLS